MRSVLALGLLIAFSASADAATAHRLRTRRHVIVAPSQGVTAPAAPAATGRFAVPGWSDESTRQWLDKASSGWGQA